MLRECRQQSQRRIDHLCRFDFHGSPAHRVNI
jgi:hypothetical protein